MKRSRTSRRLPREAGGSVDLKAVDDSLAALGAARRARRRRVVDTSDAAIDALHPATTRHPDIVVARPVASDGFTEPRPLSDPPIDPLASLPPPPVSLPPLRPSTLVADPGIARLEGIREPSIAPPAPVDPTLLPTVIPPALSLVPSNPAMAPASASPPVPVAPASPAALSLAPEALELDLSVLGPSELPPASHAAEDVVPVVELEEVELDEVRLSSEPSAPKRVAPPLPPPVLRRAR